MKGIDISDYQRGLDVASLKSKGIGFAILKLGYGTTIIDSCFSQFYDQAVSAGIPVGAYFYSLATTEAEAIRDAKKALSIANGRKLPLGIYMDVEEKSQLALRDSVLTGVVKAFCDTIRAGGYIPGAYGSSGNLWAKVGPSYVGDDILVWKAQWSSYCPNNCDLWQYSATTRIDGYNGPVDGDESVSNRFMELIAKGYGSEVKPEPEPESTPEQISNEKEYTIEIPAGKSIEEIIIRVKFKNAE